MENIGRTFRTSDVEINALNGIDLSIQQGEFVSIMGPSGCGKTTLLNIMGLLDPPTSGRYYFWGQDVTEFNEKQRGNLRKLSIGIVFQSFNLIDELTVFQNIELPLVYLDIPAAERKTRVLTLMEQLNLLALKDHRPNVLSGGQQQRIAIARAVSTNPRILLADEPTGNLDSNNGRDVMNLLVMLNRQGTTLLMVTHSKTQAEMGHRILHMLDGKIVTQSVIEKFEKSGLSRNVF